MKKSGIYLIKNTVNNKVYVGSAVNIDRRWKKHKRLLKEGKHHSSHLQCAWDKYGEQSFIFDVIEKVLNPEHLIAREQVYLDMHKSYERDRDYNVCKVAGSQLGMKRSEETKKKIGEANKRRIITEETRQKLSEAKKNISEETRQKYRQRKHTEETKQKIGRLHKGKVVSEETRIKISEANKGRNVGRKLTEETRRKISEANKNRKLTEETRQKMSEAKKSKNNQ